PKKPAKFSDAWVLASYSEFFRLGRVEYHSFHARGLCPEHALHFALRPRPCLGARAQTLARKSFGGNCSHPAAGHSACRNRLDSAEAFWPSRSNRRISVSKFSSRH